MINYLINTHNSECAVLVQEKELIEIIQNGMLSQYLGAFEVEEVPTSNFEKLFDQICSKIYYGDRIAAKAYKRNIKEKNRKERLMFYKYIKRKRGRVRASRSNKSGD